ncbi:hypothetical protein BAC2_00086 [uncultured bacterium]|nr:hypothetical protein BAC2_00086 [uncultured bacterium]
MPQFDLRVGASPLFALLAIAIAVVVAVLYYRITLPPVAPYLRRILMVLRGLALLLLLLLFLEPILRIISTTVHRPVLSVLVDDSKSMGITDKSGNRASQARAILQSPPLARIAERADVRYVAFSTGALIVPPDSLDSLSFNGDGTDLASAMHTAAAAHASASAHAMLVISDGVTTIGKNPLHDAASYGIPVYSVGVGDAAEQLDVLVSHVAGNAIVYAGVPAPVDVIVKSAGYPGQKVEVTIADGQRVMDRKPLTLEDGVREYELSLTYTPEGEGVRSYTVAVTSLPGELTTKNNRRTFSARVRKSALMVLVIAGAPSPDVSAVRQSIAEVEQFSVRSFTQSPSGQFFEGALRREVVDSADCVVLVGYPGAGAQPGVLESVFGGVNARPVPVLVVATKNTDLRALARIADWLPFTAEMFSIAEYEVAADPTASEKAVPVFTPEHREQDDPWLRLPPVFTTRTVITARPDATVHAVTRAQGIDPVRPVILSRRVDRRRVVALAAHGVWRWRLMAQRSAQTESFFGELMANTLRWLTAPDDAGPVIAKPFKESFAQGEPLLFTAQVYDPRGNAVEDAEVKLTIAKGGEVREALLSPRGNGRYEGGTAGIHTDGLFRYKVTASRSGAVLGSDSGQVHISGTAIEFLNTRMDEGTLTALAARTGGAYMRPDEIGRLDSLLAGDASFAPRTTSSVAEIHVRMSPWYMGVVILLLAAEWFIRKRSGMI